VKILQKNIICIFIFLFSLQPLFGQYSGEVKGVVKDLVTNEIIIGANIYLKGTHTGSASDENGEYSIPKIPSGNHVLIVSSINYSTIEHPITISEREEMVLNFDMEENTFGFSDVVVTATRSEQLITSVPVSTEVLSAKKLKQLNAKNVGQALESVGGAVVKSYGAVGSLETISLRGSTDSQVLILIDGQRLNDAQSGSVDLSSIPLDAVEKIEVVKGGHAALYGSDAVGGVINIITKSMAHKNNLDLSANGTIGSFGTSIYDASIGQGINNFDYFVSYNRTQSDGDYEFTNDTDEKVKMVNGDTKADNIFAKAGYLFSNSSRLSTFMKYRHSNNGSPGSIDYPNASARNKVDNYHTSINYEGLKFGSTVLNLNAYSIFNNHRYVNPESWMGIEDFYYKSRSIGLTTFGFTDLGYPGLLSYGYEFRQDRLETEYKVNDLISPFIGNHQRNVHSLFLQDDFVHYFDHDWKTTIIPAVRLDNYPEENVGSQLTPKVGLTFGHEGDWRGSIRGNIGRVFRAPSYNDLYWPEDSWTKGNPELKPESGSTYDFGFITQFEGLGSWSIEATYFASNLKDLILWAPGDESQGFKWLPSNVASAKTTGYESKLNWRGLNNILGLQLSYTSLSAKDDGNNSATKDKFLIYRPKDKLDFLININYGIASFNLIYNYVGKRFHDAENTIELDNYSLFNTNVSISPELFGVNWLMRFEVNNLADDEIVITKGSPVPGREIRFTVGINSSIIN
jgi:outer membrane cobalamin receptor